MKPLYHPSIAWFLLATFALAFVFVIIGSPVHRANDPLFWFMAVNVAGLVFLSVILRYEKDEEDKAGFVRLFFLGDWLLVFVMAADVIWSRARAGTLW